MTRSEDSAARRPGDPHRGDLLERALAQLASPEELAELRLHGRDCAACAALLELGPGLATRLSVGADSERDQRVVARALAAPRVASRRGLVFSLSAAALLFGSLAAAQYLSRPTSTAKSGVAQHVPAPPAVVVAPAGPRAAALTTAKPEQAEPESGAGVDAMAPKPPTPTSAEPIVESPSAVFARANQLRSSGHDSQAIEGYHHLQQLFPHSNEAALSAVTLGALLLQRGDPRGALAQFERYVATGGPVVEEALAGRARAFAQLGDRPGELASWQSLLERFPRSLHAARARSRMNELR